ncbi:dehydrogenase with different specificitie [Trematosphaeria pertusa]|uniref:Dehydrogenase with different specificitie n=1 Tax=Trematosphaeria pertusa TaxID=390896 RepID=A0A6A6HTM9_9PLEO|nr:dehydrogenase with different specificitie [Trematosphaeria pertusa]KAF2241544.1 dehydrogenase with different specificitie [Trematosphaeria pertusa]
MPCHTTFASFNPDSDIPDLSEKVILITGGTAGLGTETILQLAKHNPARIIFTGRNAAAAEAVIQSVKSTPSKTELTFIPCDFTSLDNVRDAGKEILARNTRLDILVCNAGVMALPKGLTKDGYEIQFGINHIAHALLIQTVLPLLLQTANEPNADVRIISLSSLGFTLATTIDFPLLKIEHDMGALGALKRYGQTKLANLLYAQQLAKRYPQITSVAVHPGVVNTELGRGLSAFYKYFVQIFTVGQMISVQDGAKNQLWAATTDKAQLVSGAFYEPVGSKGRSTKASQDEELADRLWEWTEEQVKPFL